MHFSIFLRLFQLYLKFQCFSKNCFLFLLYSTSFLCEIQPFSFLFLYTLQNFLILLPLHFHSLLHFLLYRLFLITHLRDILLTFLSNEPCFITTVLPSISITFPG